MRPTPIPDAEVWPGAVRRVISPPGGDLTNPDIAPVEALVDRSPTTGAVNLSVRCVLEDDDLAKLQAGGVVWLTFWGAMVPWSATVAAPDESRRRCPRCGEPSGELNTTSLRAWTVDVCEPCVEAMADDCKHDWTLRPESETSVCEICGAER